MVDGGTFSFEERLRWSDGSAPTLDAVWAIVANRIPGSLRIEKADLQSDKDGTDYFVQRAFRTRPLSIDLKIRDEDYAAKCGEDDLALESWSVMPENGNPGKIGWTRDSAKHTDYVLWYWKDTGRFCLVDFRPLCWAFSRQWAQWAEQYKAFEQRTVDTVTGGVRWRSQCVFVPRSVVFAAVRQWQGDGSGYCPPPSPQAAAG